MKKIVYSLTMLLLVTLGFQSCEDLEEVDAPSFEIAFNTNAKVGEPVEFKIKNAPNFLYFFAGDFEHQYKFRDRTNAEGTVTMSFLNSQKWGLGANATGNLSVWYSKDYDGSGSAASVNIATWTEITDRFNISTLYDFTLQESGIVDITDLADGKPIYFGFKYFCDDTTTRPSEWYLDNLNIQMDVADAPAPLTVASEDVPGFKGVDVQGIVSGWNANKWYWDSGKKLWRMRGQVKVGGEWIVNEDWLITNAINLTKVAPDKGTPLKTYSEKLETFEYTYTKAGTYTITFIANNETIHGQQEKIQEYTITVTD
ncbi:DUF5017 domain-containing protein [Flavivirga spongiicola]|uniref:DUF5017 domain-containing protein n=1 Tax=Flavivirga spongiicola TaxID=421621 RepID=A0ABU7XWL3_9FLAO|nr:DUF5017 domain-containing protein [Flavivirga sp. MEBiC05379]MDO5980170.1 DUF5017 domain-containing protein [Flavivirga sp. MEBiC05379]